MKPHTILALVLAALAVLCLPASASKVTAFLHNKTPANLTLDYYSNESGDFTSTPPAQVGAFSRVTWAMSGSISVDGIPVGFMHYRVDYSSPDYLDCIEFEYAWNAIVGQCTSHATSCPASKRQYSEPSPQCFTFIDQCSPQGNPIHLLTLTDCPQS
jgi:hypothetical protein